MARVGEQGERACDETACRLGNHEAAGQASGDEDARLVGRAVDMARSMAMPGMVVAGTAMPAMAVAFMIVSGVVMIAVIMIVAAMTGRSHLRPRW